MKITLELTLKKTDGKAVEPDEIVEHIDSEWFTEELYVQGADNDEESTYEVTGYKVIASK